MRDLRGAWALVEARLGQALFFAGDELTAADIMMVFPTDFTESLNIVDLSAYPHIVAWRTAVQGRPAYKKMLSVARPDGVPGMPKPLPKT